jgi:hypothetical protein
VTAPPTDWTAVARTKLVTVLGPAKGETMLAHVLQALGTDVLRSADDLYRFAQVLATQSGFAGAVGEMLSVHALLRGARGANRTSP